MHNVDFVLFYILFEYPKVVLMKNKPDFTKTIYVQVVYVVLDRAVCAADVTAIPHF